MDFPNLLTPPPASSDWYLTRHDDDSPILEVRSQDTHCVLDRLHVQTIVGVDRRVERDEDEVRMRESLAELRGKRQGPFAHVPMDKLVKSRLEDRGTAGTEPLNNSPRPIEADHGVTQLRPAARDHRAKVP